MPRSFALSSQASITIESKNSRHLWSSSRSDQAGRLLFLPNAQASRAKAMNTLIMQRMRVFIAFAREACALGKKSNLPAWSDRELDQRCREFLLSIVIDAWEDKAKDLGIGKMFSSPHHWGY